MEALARATGREPGPQVGAPDAVICGLEVRGALASPVPDGSAPQPGKTMTASRTSGAKRRISVVQSPQRNPRRFCYLMGSLRSAVRPCDPSDEGRQDGAGSSRGKLVVV